MLSERGYWHRVRSRRIGRRRFISGSAAAGLGAASLAAVGCGDDDDDDDGGATPGGGPAGSPTEAAGAPRPGGRWQAFTPQDVGSLDPFKLVAFTSQAFVGAYAYSRLFKSATGPAVDPANFEIVPDLAESIESPDELTRVITLKPGVKFQNLPPVSGRVLDSEDVTFTYDRFTALSAQATFLVDAVERVEAPDAQTVRFILKRPFAPFLPLLTFPGYFWIMPREADAGFDPERAAIGTGPWILEKHEPSVGLTYAKNPDYFVPGRPYMDGVDIYVVGEYVQQINQFKAGRLNTVQPQAQDFSDIVASVDGASVLEEGIPNFVGAVSFGRLEPQSPAVTDDRVRKAVSMAIDRDGLIEAITNAGIWDAAGQPIRWEFNNFIPAAFGQWWVDPRGDEMGDAAQWFQYDPDAAKALLAEAGFDGGLDIDFHRTVTVYGAQYDSAAEALVPMLEAAGFKPNVQVNDYRAEWSPTIWDGQTRGLMFGLGTPFADPTFNLNYFFGSESSRNHLRIQDEEFLRMHQAEQAELDSERRRELLVEIQRYLGDKMYVVPLHYATATSVTVLQPFVRGYEQYRTPSGSYGAGTETLLDTWLEA